MKPGTPAQPNELRSAIQTVLMGALEREPDVAAGYLFGSVARGVAGLLSDIDVALLIANKRASRRCLGE